jgi:hypothetical protein
MRDDLLTLPPRRDLPPGEALRRQRHLVSEARATLGSERSPGRASHRRGHRRAAQIALAAGLVLGLVLSGVALGGIRQVASWLSGLHAHDPGAPVPIAPDVLVASGAAGARWEIIATPTDQGLCLFLMLPDEKSGHGGCGPSDVRGDPWARRPGRHWIGAFGAGGGDGSLHRTFAFGPVAQGVASVDLVLTDGETVRAHLVQQPKGLDAPLGFYWAEWPCGSSRCVAADGPTVKMAIARDSTGRIIERRLPSWNGNPTGIVDGSPPPTNAD